jgi:hypothetical protein
LKKYAKRKKKILSLAEERDLIPNVMFLNKYEIEYRRNPSLQQEMKPFTKIMDVRNRGNP